VPGTVVQEVTTLAQRTHVAEGVVAWIMVQVNCRKRDPRHPSADQEVLKGKTTAHHATMPVAPFATSRIPPAAVTEVKNSRAVRSPTLLEDALGPLEADHSGELLPVDGIKPTVSSFDRSTRREIVECETL
jgi:hypothetical protein